VAVARFQRVRQTHGATLDRVFHVRHDQALADFGHALFAEVDHFGEVVARVHVQQREGQFALQLARCAVLHLEGLFGQVQHHARILAAGKQQGRALETGGHFTQDEDGFFFQGVQVAVVHIRQQLVHVTHLVFFQMGWPFGAINHELRSWLMSPKQPSSRCAIRAPLTRRAA
jgi:hypothetical protein